MKNKLILLLLSIMLLSMALSGVSCKRGNGGNTGQEKIIFNLYSDEIQIFKGDNYKIKYDYNGNKTISFDSYDREIINISQDGIISGIKAGSTFVKVSVENESKIISVKVINKNIMLAFGNESVAIPVKSEKVIPLTVNENEKAVDLNSVEFSANSDLLKFESTGGGVKCFSETAGNYILSAKYKNKTASVKIKIVNPDATVLKKPKIVIRNHDTVVFENVEHADKYVYKINNGDLLQADKNEISFVGLSDNLKAGESVEILLKAVTDSVDYIDGEYVYVEVKHNFLPTEDIKDCESGHTVTLNCDECGRRYTDNDYVKGHNFKDGKCVACGKIQTEGLTYEYIDKVQTGVDADKNPIYKTVGAYWVTNAVVQQTDVHVLSEYDDGVHGVLPVTGIGQAAFANNAVIEEVYLPESVTEISPQAFAVCIQLKKISMPGVKEIDGRMSQANQFLGDINLTTVIIPDGFTNKTNAFSSYYEKNYTSKIKFYVTSLSGTVNAPITEFNDMLTGEVYFYDELGVKCETWRYADNGDIVMNYNHSYSRIDGKVKCSKCGKYYATDFKYNYNKKIEGYEILGAINSDAEELYLTERYYDDGINGVHEIKKIANFAFGKLTKLKRISFPETVTMLTDSTFAGCNNLEYAALPGLVRNVYAESGGNHFINCDKLKTVILGKSFYTNCQMFFNLNNAPAKPVCDIYLYSDDGTFGTFETAGNQNLLSGKIYKYDQNSNACGTWKYNEDKTDAISFDHIFSDGKCLRCGIIKDTEFTYEYVSELDGYAVTSYLGSNPVMRVRETFNDGIHGDKNVVAIGSFAFDGNKVIVKAIFPKTVTSWGAKERGAIFRGCSNLEYVALPGLTKNAYWTNGNNQFAGCTKLRTVILGKEFSTDCQMFIADTAPETPILDICLYSEDGTFGEFKPHSNDKLLSGKVYKYDANGKCSTWKYNDDKTDVILNAEKHVFVDGICSKCGYWQEEIKYTYDESKNGYVITGYSGGLTEIYARATYNDGTHGEKNVVAIGERAFNGKTEIVKAIFPKTATSLKGGTFGGCTNLEYVALPGLTSNVYAENGDNHFAGCTKLKTVILGKEFSTNCQMFFADTAPETPILDIYLYSDDGSFGEFKTAGNQNLLSGKVYKYNENGGAGTWKYNDDKTGVIVGDNN